MVLGSAVLLGTGSFRLGVVGPPCMATAAAESAAPSLSGGGGNAGAQQKQLQLIFPWTLDPAASAKHERSD
jgi:hypothetical protein